MPRGGFRENAGGKPTWNYGKTKTIRVPVEIAEKVLAYARQLDNAKKFTEPVTESKTVLSKTSLKLLRPLQGETGRALSKVEKQVRDKKFTEPVTRS